jgi:hypothetical protein
MCWLASIYPHAHNMPWRFRAVRAWYFFAFTVPTFQSQRVNFLALAGVGSMAVYCELCGVWREFILAWLLESALVFQTINTEFQL